MEAAKVLLVIGLLGIGGLKRTVLAGQDPFRPSIVKVGMRFEPIAGQPINLLCNASLADLQKTASRNINWANLKCGWWFNPRQSKINAHSVMKTRYEVFINKDNYDGETVSCDRYVSSLRFDQDGYYKCEFDWKDVADISNKVQSDRLDLAVLYAPTGPTKISMSPDPSFLKAEMPITLTCSVDPSAPGNPPVTYEWRQAANPNFSHIGSVLPLVYKEGRNLDAYETYECLPENRIGKGTPTSIDVGIKPQPFLSFLDTVSNHSAIHTKGNRNVVQLECSAVGYPQFSLHWCPEHWVDCKIISQILVGSAMEDIASNSSQIKGSYRSFQHVSRNVSVPSSRQQEGQWSCVALRNDGNGTEIVKQRTVYLATERGPEFCLNRTVVHGVGASSTATLQCQASGRPRPELTWSVLNKEGTLVDLQSSQGITVGQEILSLDSDKTSKDLFIWKVSTEDANGRYFCSAANKYGRIQLQFIFNPTDSEAFVDTEMAFDQMFKSTDHGQSSSFPEVAQATVGGLGGLAVVLIVIGVILLLHFRKNRKEAVAVVATAATQYSLDKQRDTSNSIDLQTRTGSVRYTVRPALDNQV